MSEQVLDELIASDPGKLPNGSFFYPLIPYAPDDCDYADLDAGIAPFVRILRGAGIETYESCEGSDDHAFKEPTIRFHGERGEGFRALAIAMENGLPVSQLRRTWDINDGEPTGATWEMVFYKKAE